MTTHEIPEELAYPLLNTALERFQKSTADLEAREFAQAQVLARRQQALESRILASPEAEQVGLSEKTWREALAEIRERYPDHREFVSDLARNGLTPETFERGLKNRLHGEAVLEYVASRAARINELDVDIYYYMHPEKFVKPETRTVRHILITVNPDYPENQPQAARQRMETIARRVWQTPHRFEEQAQKHSECPTAMHGGLIGKLPRGQLYPELDAVLFNLKPNQISQIVESEMGYHLLLCESVEAESTIPLEDARPKIFDLLNQRRRRVCQKYWLSRLLKPVEAELDHAEA